MESVRAEMAILESLLCELLSNPAFVALLNHQGHVTMPRVLWNRLSGRDS
jgi:broad-specificity NMP kinase